MTPGPRTTGAAGGTLLGLLLAVALLPAAQGGWVEDRDGTTILHVKVHTQVIPDPSKVDTANRADVAVVREFVRRFPRLFAEKYRDRYQADPLKYGRHNWDSVEVELHHFTGIKVEGVETTLLAVAGKTPPDVLYVNFRQSDSYIQQGFLYPLDRPEDGYLAAMTEEEKAFRVHPKIWPVIHRRGPPRGDKHVWALPWGGALGKVCWYRKDLFDAAGLPYPKNDWTWEDFYQAARKLSAPGRGLYGVCFLKGKHESWNWVNFLWSAGGDVMTYDDATDTWTAVFDSREAAVALDFYTRLCTEPWTDSQGRRRYGYAYKDAWEAFDLKWQRGEIGMTLAYIDGKLFAQLNPDVTGMVPVPIGPTGIRGAELNSRMMGLYADIPDRAVRDAAWEFVRFFDCQDAVGIKTRVMVEGGLGRFVNPKYLRLFGYEELIRLAPRGWSDIFEIAINTGMPEPYGKDSNYAYDILTEPLLRAEELALDGKLPADREQRLDVLQGLLRTAKKKADEQMLGIVPPDVRATRRRTAVLVLLALVGTFVLVLRKVARAFTPPAAAGRGRAGWQFRRYRLAYLLLLPAVLTILVWQYVPLARGSVMAFMDYKILGGSRWVWLDNFGDLLWSRDWWHSIEASLRYSLLVIALTFLPPVVLAILLQEVPRGKMLFRTLFYLPAVMTGLVVVILWKTFYDPNETGMVNGLLLRIPAVAFVLAGLGLFAVCVSFARRLWFHGSGFPALLFLAAGILMGGTLLWVAAPIFAEAGVNFRREPLASVPRAFAALLDTLPEPYRWLGSSDTALFCCVLPIVWAGVGPGCLIYLAALKGISDDFYEAADVDGATFTDKMLFVVFPILKPLLVINFVGCFIAAWQSTANILAMTGGGYGTEVAALHIFYRAFIYLKLGPATAMAWMLAFLLIGFTIHQLTILSRLEFRTTGEEKK